MGRTLGMPVWSVRLNTVVYILIILPGILLRIAPMDCILLASDSVRVSDVTFPLSTMTLSDLAQRKGKGKGKGGNSEFSLENEVFMPIFLSEQTVGIFPRFRCGHCRV